MATIQVAVKWNRQLFSDVEVTPGEGLDVFKAQLFALTNVPPERQKVMCKGKILKVDADVSKIKDGSKIMLMGSADALPQGPSKQIVFEEDLTDTQKADMGVEELPPGLDNLGNTCYLNSAISCLRQIPELKSNLIQYSRSSDPTAFGSKSTESGHRLASSMGSLMSQLDSSVNSVMPAGFLTVFRSLYPQFDQKGPHGHMQQDADESLSQIMYALRQQMPKFPDEAVQSEFTGVNGLFKGQIESTISCDEEEEKSEVQVKKDEFTKLRCHISIDTNHLSDGMSAALEEKIEKYSETLQRNAVFTKRDKISKLPPYLMVQFVRFFWKKDTQKKAKILRKVVFPHRLDVSSMCCDELKTEVLNYRDQVDQKANAERERIEQEEKKQFEKAQAALNADGSESMQVDQQPSQKKESNDANLRRVSNPHVEKSSGMYELFALITHKGRAADSGHYIGWARGKKENEWFKFDDNVVTKQTDDDIMNLCGGGDWHMAYVCFYRACPWRM